MNKKDKKSFKETREYLISKIEKRLTDKRFEHTLRVEETALKLAEIHKGDPYKVSLAAILHDNAKNYSNEKKLRLCNKYHVHLSKAEEENIDLVHSKLGGILAKDKYHIDDIEIIHAIMYHTTGRPHMSKTEKIIYIADFIEPGRKEFPGLKKARELAEIDLDLALIKILMLTINHIIDRGKIIDSITEETYEFYYKLYSHKHTP
jgi:predicted HD superfamily hydrolase involved in NAD metabolism